MVTPIPPEVRFLRRVAKAGPDECWLWTGQLVGKGRRYGAFRPGTLATDPRVYVHRYAYELWVGPIPEGMEIDHVRERGCTSTLCVNPRHLEPVTPAENKTRARLTRCRSGEHDLTLPENVQWDSKGRRRGCRPCHLRKARRHAAERYERMKNP